MTVLIALFYYKLSKGSIYSVIVKWAKIEN